jgi:photosystem II stability/assembly factor-like uncharacterized protein
MNVSFSYSFSAVFGLAVLLHAAAPAGAEVFNSWEPISPGGSRVRALAVAPGTTNLYAATAGGGIYFSFDRGAHWLPLSSGLADFDAVGVQVSPAAPQVVFAGTSTDLYRSSDGGVHWLHTGFGRPVAAFALAPSSPDRIYATDGQAVLLSVDGGLGWTRIDAGLPSDEALAYSALAVAAGNPLRAYLASAHEIFITVDGGASWVGSMLPGVSQVFAIVPDPQRPRRAFAATDAGVFVIAGGATAWSRVQGLPAGAYSTLAAAPASPGTFYAATDRSRGRLWRSTDGGVTWKLVLANGPFTALASDPQRARQVFAAVTPGGVWHSNDAGASWLPPGPGLDAPDVEELALDPRTPGLLQARAHLVPPADPADGLPAGLVRRSADGGASWQDTGLGPVQRLAADPSSAGAFYALLQPTGLTAGILPASPATGLMHTGDGGASWQPAGTIPFAALDLAAAASDPRTLVAVGYTLAPTGGPCPSALCSPSIGKSTDGGATWSILDSAPLPPSGGPPRLVRIAPEDSRVIYVAAGTLLRSDDGGASWTTLASQPLTDLTLDPRQPRQLYGVAGGVALGSTDGGATWLPLGAGLPAGAVRGLALDPFSPTGLFAATSQGAYASTDGGSSWSLLGASQPFTSVLTIVADPGRAGTVYAGIEGTGGLFVFVKP